MSRSMAVLAVVILAAATCGGGPLLRADQPEDPAKFESDPLMGGEKNVITRFRLTLKWDRIRKLILAGDGFNATALVEWVKWAQTLQPMPPTERLLAINKRVNRDFKYSNDDDIWGQADHWADPAEAVRKKRLDCEDFAIFKFFLAHTPALRTRIWRLPSARSGAPASFMP